MGHIHRVLRSQYGAGSSPASVTISPSSVSLSSGTTQLTAAIRNAAGGALNLSPAWTSDAPSVVTVDSSGVVTFVSSGSAHITATVGLLTSNSCTVTAGTVTGTNLAKLDFNTMTSSGPTTFTGSPKGDTFTAFAPWNLTVIADPTGSGRGNVVNIPYSVSEGDDNRDLSPTTGISIGLGQEIWFQGDVYIDPAARMDFGGSNGVQRKLLYWGPPNLESGPLGFSLVLSSFGPQFFINKYPNSGQNNPNFNPEWPYPMYIPYPFPGFPFLTSGAWHTFKVQLRVNSTFAAIDGIVRIWYDGTKFVDQTQVSWTDPTVWAGHSPSEFAFVNFKVGDQIDNAFSGVPASEFRLWDNLSFATTEDAL